MKIGIDCTSLTKHHDGGKEQVLYNLLEGFHRLKIDQNLCLFCFSYSADKIRALVPQAKIVLLKPNRIPKKLLADVWTKTFALPKAIRKEKADLLFFPVSNTGLRKFPIPTVVIPHDIQPIARSGASTGLNRFKYRCVFHFDFSLRDRIVSISDFDTHQIAEFYPQHAGKIRRIYNPIALEPPNMPVHREPIITAVNIRFRHKNIETLIRAFASIQDRIPHTLTLIGRDDHETTYLHDLVKELNLTARVCFTGFVSDADLQTLLKQSALYVNPSLYEGFGMTAVEAMIMRVPVLVAKTTASPETTKGLCAYYEPARDESKLASAMLEQLENPADDFSLDAISKEIYQAYRVETIADEYHSFFQELLEKRTKGTL